MSRRALAILVIAIVFAAGAAVAIATSISSSGGEPVHTLPGGEVHTGELPEPGSNAEGER
jgi:hypothetical protein